MLEAPRIGHQIPIARKSHKALHRHRIHRVGLLHGVGRARVIHHAKASAVARDRRAAQTLQDAELNLMRPQGVQPVKAGGKAGQRLPGQAKNKIKNKYFFMKIL